MPLLIKRLFFSFLYLCSIAVFKAQDKQLVDSLYNLAASGADTVKINALNELSLIFSETDTQKALQTAFKALGLSKNIKSQTFIAGSLNRIGTVYDYKSMPDSANYYYLYALKLFEKLNSKSGIASVYQNLGILYYLQEDFETALVNYKKALDLRVQTNEDKYISKLYNNIGATLRRQKKYNEAISYYEKALELKLKQNDKAAIAATYQNIAIAYEYKENLLKALEYLNKAVEINKTLNNYYDLTSNYSALSELYIYLKDYKKAKEFGQLAREFSVKAESPEQLYNAYELSWILDTLDNDYRSAVHNLYLARSYRNKLFKKETSNSIEKLRIIYETEKKDNEISLLNMEKEVKRKERKQLVAITTLISLLLITVSFYYIKKRKDNWLLARQKQEIIDKTTQLNLLAEEIAKHRSQMNPHFIFNALNTLQGLILNNDIDKSIKQLNGLSKLMRQTLNNSENEWISLHDEIDYLKNYVDFELQRFERKFDFIINIDPGIDINNTAIAPMLIQPLIENCLKHAGLNTVKNAQIILRINLEDDKLKVVVEDNGLGRKTSSKEHQSRASGILQKRILEINKKANTESTGLKYVDLKDDSDNALGTTAEFKIAFTELY